MHFLFLVTLLLEAVLTLSILLGIMVVLKRTYVFKITSILVMFNLN